MRDTFSKMDLSKHYIKLGCAPINWTNDDLPELGGELTFEQCISEMALAGFTGSEVGNKYPEDVKELARALDLRGMQICNQWFSCEFLIKPQEETLARFEELTDRLNTLGAKVVGVCDTSVTIQGDITKKCLMIHLSYQMTILIKLQLALIKWARLQRKKECKLVTIITWVQVFNHKKNLIN